VVAGVLSLSGQNILKDWQLQMTPCCKGQVNDTMTMVLRDTGSTTCIDKSSLVRPEQMIGSHELCMLIDGVVKRYPTAVVELKTPYYTGTVLCMDSPVQGIIIGNIPGALGAEVTCNHDDSTETLGDLEPVNEEMTIKCDKSNNVTIDHRDQINTSEEQNVNSDDQLIDHSDTQEQCAAVQTRAIFARESKPPKPLKVKSMPGSDIGPDELKAKQKADPTLRKYWQLADKSVDGAKQQFFTKKCILYRRYCGKQNTDNLIQLVVPMSCVRR